MYIIASGPRIYGFGLTEEAARRHLVRRSLHYEGPPLETYPCSPELYRQLEADTSRWPSFGVSYRLDTNGIAVPAKLDKPAHNRWLSQLDLFARR